MFMLEPKLLLASRAEFSAWNDGNGVGAFDTSLLSDGKFTFFIELWGFEMFYIAEFRLTLGKVVTEH